jgi:hypothetical protein
VRGGVMTRAAARLGHRAARFGSRPAGRLPFCGCPETGPPPSARRGPLGRAPA